MNDKMGTIIASIIGAVAVVVAAIIGLYGNAEKSGQIARLERQVQPKLGRYEWQWAGDRSFVTADVASTGSGFKVTVFGRQKCPNDKWSDQFLMGEGPATQQSDGSLHIDITAQVTSYDYDCKTLHSGQDQIVGDLQPVPALAGSISWTENGKSSPGDMVLVKYKSTRSLFNP